MYLNLDTNETVSCSGHPIVYVQRQRIGMDSCRTVHPCDWLEGLPNKKGCYIQCRCHISMSACHGEVFIRPGFFVNSGMFCSLNIA